MDIPLAEEVRAHFGAERTILIKDMKALVAGLKEKGLYLIARIVVFKDDPLAAARPQWAVKVQGGGVFRDRERLRWVDPFQQGGLGLQHRHRQGSRAELGFDEIQFDYVRCPDKERGGFQPTEYQENRTEAISGFLKAAHEALAPLQRHGGRRHLRLRLLEPGRYRHRPDGAMTPSTAVDVVCPMLYPSGYQSRDSQLPQSGPASL